MKKVEFNKARNEPKKKLRVYVATYTNEGLKFQMIIGPLKFDRSRRGGDYTSRKTTVATI